MALKDLKSDLKDLSFGKGRAYDRPGQGFSREPFMTKPLIDLPENNLINTITGGFIRGGALTHAERNITDVARFGKFFISPRGITWNLKQLGLQKTNPDISAPSLRWGMFSRANQRTWNLGINTLAQIAGQGTGLHIKREGLTPLASKGYADAKKLFADPHRLRDKNPKRDTNRLLYLFGDHISKKPSKTPKSKLGKFIKKVGEKLSNLLPENQSPELYLYNSGPGSTYGIGSTSIKKYMPFNGFPKGTIKYKHATKQSYETFLGDEKGGQITISSNEKKGNIIFGLEVGTTIFEKDDLDNLTEPIKNTDKFGREIIYQKDNFKKIKISDKKKKYKIEDYHKFWESNDHILNGTSRVKNYLHTLGRITEDNYNKKRSDGKTYHREERVNLGNPGGNPTAVGNSTVDLLNALDVFESGGILDHNAIRDLIRFRIEAVDPLNPTQSNVMVFRAFLDSLSDSFNANYNEFTYNGRGENFYTYNGFNRDISFSFKIAAQSSREMKPLYRKLNYLLSNTAPEYNDISGRMMTPFMRLTIGAYFDRLPGVIKNVGITWQKDYPWEITLDAPEGGSTSGLFVLPHVLDINVTYQPIHDFLPQKGIDSPFIVPHKDSPITNGKEGRKSWNSEPISKTIWKTETIKGEEVKVADTEGLDIAIDKLNRETRNL